MNAQRIREIVGSHERESQRLDFKRTAPATKADRPELLKDVTAMANAEGGVLLFGISDKSDRAEELIGIESADSVTKRISAWCLKGVDPPLLDVEIYVLKVDTKAVVVVEIPNGPLKPYSYEFENRSWFQIRVGNDTREMKAHEIARLQNQRPKPAEREAVRKLIVFLQDRRVLHASDGLFRIRGQHARQEPWVNESVLEIRARITRTLEDAIFPRDIRSILEGMAGACRDFLDDHGSNVRALTPEGVRRNPGVRIGRLRLAFGNGIPTLCVRYGIELEGHLVTLSNRAARFGKK